MIEESTSNSELLTSRKITMKCFNFFVCKFRGNQEAIKVRGGTLKGDDRQGTGHLAKISQCKILLQRKHCCQYLNPFGTIK